MSALAQLDTRSQCGISFGNESSRFSNTLNMFRQGVAEDKQGGTLWHHPHRCSSILRVAGCVQLSAQATTTYSISLLSRRHSIVVLSFQFLPLAVSIGNVFPYHKFELPLTIHN